MEIGSFGIWLLLASAGVIVWIWFKRGREKPGNEWIGWTLLRERLLRLLHAVDQEQLSQVEQQFELERSEISARLDRLEMSLTQQGRLENWATEVNGRLSQLELSQTPTGKKSVTHSRTPKSVLCFGIRVTITNQIWYELGKVPPQDLSDSQIGKYVHGPFCRNCLRSLIVNNSKDSEKSVRSRCQYCSLVWREDSSSLLSLRQVKREAYEYLDAAYRRSNDLAL